jgi:hypothetical protein
LFCRDKQEITPSWAKSEGKYKRNTHSSFWPKQSKGEKKEKPTQVINLGEARCRSGTSLLTSPPTKGGGEGGQPWCGRTRGAPAPPLAPLGTSLGRLTLTASPMTVVEVSSRFNVPKRQFGAFHVGERHIPWTFPLHL